MSWRVWWWRTSGWDLANFSVLGLAQFSNRHRSLTSGGGRMFELPFDSWIQAPLVGCGANTIWAVEGGQIAIRENWVRKGRKRGVYPFFQLGLLCKQS